MSERDRRATTGPVVKELRSAAVLFAVWVGRVLVFPAFAFTSLLRDVGWLIAPITAGVAVLPLLASRRFARVRRGVSRAERGLCPSCAYPLIAESMHETCPECGWTGCPRDMIEQWRAAMGRSAVRRHDCETPG
jgi:hypothetical protein